MVDCGAAAVTVLADFSTGAEYWSFYWSAINP
jgi:hypothetical protein